MLFRTLLLCGSYAIIILILHERWKNYFMLARLKQKVYESNLELPKRGLVLYTWGNVSEIDREKGLVVIKPSGVNYDNLKVDDMVVVDLKGNVVEGTLKPSSDTPTHIELYKAFTEIGGIVHTHSLWATIFAQSECSIPAFGTTHADYFYGEVPCTRKLSTEEINGVYEKETGKVIIEKLADLDVLAAPGVLVSQHGPFTWGKDAAEAVYHSVVLEQIAQMAYRTILLKGNSEPIDSNLLDKHYLRKHGKNSYYGQ